MSQSRNKLKFPIWGEKKGSYLSSSQQDDSLDFGADPETWFYSNSLNLLMCHFSKHHIEQKFCKAINFPHFSHLGTPGGFGNIMFAVPSSSLNLNTFRKHITDWTALTECLLCFLDSLSSQSHTTHHPFKETQGWH